MERFPQKQSPFNPRGRSGSTTECEGGLPDFPTAFAANDERMSKLARTIEEEIIPRLMLAHRTAEPLPSAVESLHTITDDDVHAFTKLVLSQEEDAAQSTIHTLRMRDVSVEKIYLELLAPTARYLGKLWEEDLCNFTDVTVGLGRLQRVLRELSPALGRSVDHPSEGRRVLLLPSPGEQHTFGLVMVAEFFRQAGWDVSGGAWAAGSDAADLVGAEWFDVIGYSLGAEVHLPELTASITRVRQSTCNRALVVLVGGPLFGLHPEFVEQVGADGMTVDGREAPSVAESLITAKLPQTSASPSAWPRPGTAFTM